MSTFVIFSQISLMLKALISRFFPSWLWNAMSNWNRCPQYNCQQFQVTYKYVWPLWPYSVMFSLIINIQSISEWQALRFFNHDLIFDLRGCQNCHINRYVYLSKHSNSHKFTQNNSKYSHRINKMYKISAKILSCFKDNQIVIETNV